ncbi:hypothetical protein V8E36_007840 [Tilletia maclaganii]
MMPLPNTLASLQQLSETPSRADGIPADLEEELRVYGCQLIQQAGILIHLPQVAMATAQVLYQRFWYVSSMKHFSIKDISMGALFLACKLEEQTVRLRDLLNVFDYLIERALHISRLNPGPRALELRGIIEVGDVAAMRGKLRSTTIPDLSASQGHDSKQSGKRAASGSDPVGDLAFQYTPSSYFSQDFYDSRDALVVAEMQILKRLGFNVQVVLPFATLVNYLKLLGLTDPSAGITDASERVDPSTPSFAQRAWSYLNDALQTPLYCQYPPHILACGAIYLTALKNRPHPLALPLKPKPWWALFDVESEADLRIISATLLRLYDDSGWAEEEGEPAGNPPTLAHMGLASRVRDEWGGLSDLLDKKAVRQWTERSEQTTSDAWSIHRSHS